jgi:hypothetical protein
MRSVRVRTVIHCYRSTRLSDLWPVLFLSCACAYLQPDGRIMEGSPSANDDGFSTFFSETGSGKHVPRSLYVS